VPVETVDRAGVDSWAQAVIWPLDEAAAGELTPNAFSHRLADVEDPAMSEGALSNVLWSDGQAPASPEQALQLHFQSES
jgi:hypothetical protein